MSNREFHPNLMTELPFGFQGRIYRSPMPFRLVNETIPTLDQYKQHEIHLVVNLVTKEEAFQKAKCNLEDKYSDAGMKMIAFPIQDFDVPDSTKLSKVIKDVVKEAQLGKNIVVHCFAGIGRTGTFLACLAVQVFGLHGMEAINWVRKYIPSAVENQAQIDFVIQYGEAHANHEC